MTLKRNILLALMLLVATAAMATDFTGKVTDENGVAIEFATVSLLNPADSTFITGITSGTDGGFALTTSAPSAIVKITYLGYQPLFINSTGSVGTVRLLPETTMLGEVVVKGVRPTYKLTTEGIKTDVDGTLLSKVGTANKVLENLPGVQKKANGIEVFGKGTPLIYVNGRLLRDKGELDQIQSENIQSVELSPTLARSIKPTWSRSSSSRPSGRRARGSRSTLQPVITAPTIITLTWVSTGTIVTADLTCSAACGTTATTNGRLAISHLT